MRKTDLGFLKTVFSENGFNFLHVASFLLILYKYPSIISFKRGFGVLGFWGFGVRV